MIKKLSLVFTFILILLVTPIAILLMMDANEFKPELQRLAYEQGLELNLVGDLRWRVYPDILLEANEVDFRTRLEETGLEGAVGKVLLQVEVWPLFSKELSVRSVELIDSDLNITEDAAYQSLASDASRTDQSQTDQKNRPAPDIDAHMRIAKLLFENLRLTYRPVDQKPMEFHLRSLEADRLSLDGGSFQSRVDLSYASDDQLVRIQGDLDLSLHIKKERYRLASENLLIQTEGADPINASIDFSAEADIYTDQWDLVINSAQIQDLAAKGSANGHLEPLSVIGRLELSNGVDMLNTLAARDMVSSFNLTTDFNYTAGQSIPDYVGQRLVINQFAVQLNESTINVGLDYYFDGRKPGFVNLAIDQLNLDQYLSSDQEDSSEDQSSQAQNPFRVFDSLSPMSLELNVAEAQLAGQSLSDLKLKAMLENKAEGKEVEMSLNSNLAGGDILGRFILYPGEPSHLLIGFLGVSGVDLSALTKNETGGSLLSGRTDLQFIGELANVTASAPVSRLKGHGEIAITDLVLNTLNIEQSICASAQRLGATKALAEEWPRGTRFAEMKSPFEIEQGQLALQRMVTGFGHISLEGGGSLDLNSRDFDAQLSLYVGADRTSDLGCSINRYLRNTRLPLSCKGNLSEDAESSCGLDSSVVSELLKGQIKSELGRQLNRLLGAEKEADTTNENPINETEPGSSDQVKDAVKGLLEGLFKQ